jgi:hypothetical protein
MYVLNNDAPSVFSGNMGAATDKGSLNGVAIINYDKYP